jgi:integrase/recombinase XerD
MKNKMCNSSYGPHLQKFIEMKRTLGFNFKTEAVILYQIDRLAEKTSESSPGITKEFADKWCKRRCHESDFYRYTRVRLLASFSSYLCDLGIRSYIPKLPRYQPGGFIPYIYSPKEIEAIINACDELRLHQASMRSYLFSIPALIRLLYATGLRIGEALTLKKHDVNLTENWLRVRDSKNGKERIIPISNSLASVCSEYSKYRDMVPIAARKSSYFFVGLDGKKCSQQAVSRWFKKCLKKVQIPFVSRNRLPRLHDLRHTFAVTSLANMAEAGIDLYASLPILSNYLGHQSLEGTNHYVRLTATMYPELLKDVDAVCLDVFPKFKNYEAD